MRQRGGLVVGFILLAACQRKAEERANGVEARNAGVKPSSTIAARPLTQVPQIVPISVTLTPVGGNCEVTVVPDRARAPIDALINFKYVNHCSSRKKVRIEKKHQDILVGDCRSNKDVDKLDPQNIPGTVVDAHCVLIGVQQGVRYPYNIDGDVHKDPEIEVQGPGPFGTPSPP